MATTPTTAPAVPQPAAPATPAAAISTSALITTMVKFNARVSDLIISPHRPPQVELGGQLVVVPGLPVLSAQDTARLAADLIGANKRAADFLKNDGACDTSYSIPDLARFRVNVFRQRGTYAIVMRTIPMVIPSFEDLKLPPQLKDIAALKNGIVLVTGPTGSGKSSTLAAIIRLINETKAYHIVTIEAPIEFMHPHGKSTIHQRELHSDTPTFALALRAAFGEMRDRETIEIAMTASETGHLVFSTLHTIDAPKTVERIIGEFPVSEQTAIRNRLAQSFRYIVSQRLLSRKDGHGRVAAIEILKSTMRTRDYVQKGEKDGQSLHDAMKDGELEGMQHFDGVLEKMVREGIISKATALGYATNTGNLNLSLSDYEETEG
ncbi:MAG: twitching motility protein [Acidobacteria bacterium]|nr:MAG: twitching motility protein [Acidobacteriota bacterium]